LHSLLHAGLSRRSDRRNETLRTQQCLIEGCVVGSPGPGGAEPQRKVAQVCGSEAELTWGLFASRPEWEGEAETALPALRFLL
jgi:hypothetical protein